MREHLRAMGARLFALDGESGHIHPLVECLSALVNALKEPFESRVTPSRARPCAQGLGRGALVSVLLRASTGGATLDKVKQYVEAQRAATAP